MANEIERLIDAIRDDPKAINDIHSARVSRIDKEGIVWVLINGSDKETPTASTSSEVRANDLVNVEWRNNKLYIAGNYSNPSAGAARMNKVEEAASQAVTDARRANDAAASAEQSAAAAQESANDAAEAASQAWDHAVDAASAANTANTHANSALTQLSIVQDVVGTLNWISDHGTYTLTSDTEVIPGKVYFSRVESIYTPVVDPTEEGLPGYYELSMDQAVSNYVASHLALTNRGLWVLLDNNGYKLLLAHDGMYLYDGDGALVSTFGESIQFSSSRPQYIGGEDAYIIFYDSNSDGVPDSINIGGSKVTLGGNKKLSDVLTSLDVSVHQTAGGADITVNGNTVSLSNGTDGEDGVVLRIDSSRGTVFKNNQVSTVLTVTVYAGSDRITNITDLRNRFGAGAYLQWYWQRLDDSDYGLIVASDHKLSDDGFALTLTPDEVDVKVTFRCELIAD